MGLATLLADGGDTQAARRALRRARGMIDMMGYRRRVPASEVQVAALGDTEQVG
ncbi:hypothetical protein AB0M91_18565 [Micromonospora rifamycinica]|uniref:hypothetical protein n=1 Tax=Micromonospora rifamycinica TaxID=291594 RepID=UPI0034499C47